MKLEKVMDEIAAHLESITGLRVFAYPPPTLVPPAGYVSYPRSIDFDATYGRGVDRISGLPVVVVVGKASDRSARDRVAGYAAGTGPNSLKVALESSPYSSLDVLTVTSCTFDVETIAGVDYLEAIFSLDIAGRGV